MDGDREEGFGVGVGVGGVCLIFDGIFWRGRGVGGRGKRGDGRYPWYKDGKVVVLLARM